MKKSIKSQTQKDNKKINKNKGTLRRGRKRKATGVVGLGGLPCLEKTLSDPWGKDPSEAGALIAQELRAVTIKG